MTRHKYQSENKLSITDVQYTENSKRTIKPARVNIYRGNIWFAFRWFPNNVRSTRQHKEVAGSLTNRSCVEFAGREVKIHALGKSNIFNNAANSKCYQNHKISVAVCKEVTKTSYLI
jgi:hypothetical protein